MLSLVSCRKDYKASETNPGNIIPDGYYTFFSVEDSSLSNGTNEFYFVENNKLYCSIKENLNCLNRIAGEIEKKNNELSISFLHIYDGGLNPCSYLNDVYGGDTFVYHFSNIVYVPQSTKFIGVQGRFLKHLPAFYSPKPIQGDFKLSKKN